MPKVSVIVPVYGVEKYLDRCVQSIVDQTYTNWELLLIDDGSPDRSGEMCDEWKKKDERIRVLHKKNGGVSSARNLGLDNAKGEWVMFVDADDWIEKKCLKVCVDTVLEEKLDVVQFNFKQVNDDGKIFVRNDKVTTKMGGNAFIKNGIYNVATWAALISKRIIDAHNLRFPINVKLAEDQIFMMECLCEATRVRILGCDYYNYFNNNFGSVFNTNSNDIVNSIHALLKFRDEHRIWENHISRLLYDYFIMLLLDKDFSVKSFMKIYKESLPLIKTNITNKNAAIFISISKISPWLACYILRLRFQITNFK